MNDNLVLCRRCKANSEGAALHCRGCGTNLVTARSTDDEIFDERVKQKAQSIAQVVQECTEPLAKAAIDCKADPSRYKDPRWMLASLFDQVLGRFAQKHDNHLHVRMYRTNARVIEGFDFSIQRSKELLIETATSIESFEPGQSIALLDYYDVQNGTDYGLKLRNELLNFSQFVLTHSSPNFSAIVSDEISTSLTRASVEHVSQAELLIICSLVEELIRRIESPTKLLLDRMHHQGETRAYIIACIIQACSDVAVHAGISACEADLLLRLLDRVAPGQYVWDLKQMQLFSQTLAQRCSGQFLLADLMMLYDRVSGANLTDLVRTTMFRVVNLIAKADGHVSDQESAAIDRLAERMNSKAGDNKVETESSTSKRQTERNVEKSEAAMSELLDQLNSLVGLDRVKQDVQQLVNYLKVEGLRRQKGLRSGSSSLHAVFYGNPGTGKTTVARLLAQIYRSLGLLSKGHLVETDRAGLVAGYVGQTALKTQKVIEEAKGGVLFIDEAYSLARDDQDSFGQEAIDTLIKAMEDYRDDLIIIAAGYSDEMRRFISSNPGMESRFNKYFLFDDYTASELLEIFKHFAKNADYMLDPDAEAKLLDIFAEAYKERNRNFGNGRFARNLFECSISQQANRLAYTDQVTLEMLQQLTISDILDPKASGSQVMLCA